MKEANQQKCQQPSQTLYHSSGQTINVAQYLHTIQQALQPVLAPASYLTHPATLQGPGAPPHNHTQTISATLDGKANIPIRPYQVNMHYTCAAPCFDR